MLSELVGWGAKAVGWLGRRVTFKQRVALDLSKISKRYGITIAPREWRHFLYRTSAADRMTTPSGREGLLEELTNFLNDRQLAVEIFRELEVAAVKRLSHGDAAGSLTTSLHQRFDALGASQLTTPEDSIRWPERVARLRPFRAVAAQEIHSQWRQMERVLALLDTPGRKAVLESWAVTTPQILANSPPSLFGWLGDLAADLNAAPAAANFFEKAFREGAHPVGYWGSRLLLLGQPLEPMLKERLIALDHPLANAHRLESAKDTVSALAVISAWEPVTVFEEVMRDSILARVAYDERRFDDAIKAGSRARKMGSTTATLAWARALIARETFTGAELYKGDTTTALESLISLRNDLRIQGHDSAEVVVLASTAARLLSDPERAISLVRAAPAGEATDSEAGHISARSAAALMLAENGILEDARNLLESAAVDGAVAALLRAEIAKTSGDRQEEIRWTVDALNASDDAELKGRLAYRLALLGHLHPLAEEQRRLGNEVLARHLELTADAASNQSGALDRLRAAAQRSQNLSVTLAEIYARQGDAVNELKALENAAALGGGADLWLFIARRQMEAGNAALAATSADKAVSSAPPSWGALSRAVGIQVEAAAATKDWQAATLHAQTLVRLTPDDERAVWALVACQHLGGDADEALDTWRSHGEPTPISRQDVTTWLGLCQSVPGLATTATLVDLAARWATDEEIRAVILGLVMLPPKADDLDDEIDSDEQQPLEGGDEAAQDVAELDEETIARRRLVSDYFADFPNGAARQITLDLSGDGPSILEQLEDAIGERADTSEFDEQVFTGAVPLGLINAAHGGTYVESIISCASGVRFVANDPVKDTEAAQRALQSDIVLDATAVFGISRLPENVQTKLISVFGSVSVSDSQYQDAVDGLRQVNRFDHAGPNIRRMGGRVSLRVRNDLAKGEARKIAASVVGIMRSYRRLPPNIDFSPEELGAEMSAKPWLAALANASSGRTLWVDDNALRRLAEATQVQSFSTVGLLRALRDSGRLSGKELRSCLLVLLLNRYHGIPFDMHLYSDALRATESASSSIASIVEQGIQGDAGEIFEFMLTGAGTLASRPHLLAEWLSATTRWVRTANTDPIAQKANVALLARRVVGAVWAVRSTFPFIDAGMTDGMDGAEHWDPLVDEVKRVNSGLRTRSTADAASWVLDLTMGLDAGPRQRYTAVALAP